jgi:hypothetical protein
MIIITQADHSFITEAANANHKSRLLWWMIEADIQVTCQ